MDFARIGAARRVLGFESIEFFEHLDREPHGIVIKTENRLRVVKEDIRVQDVMLHFAPGLGDGRLARKSRRAVAQQPASENCLNVNVLTPATQTGLGKLGVGTSYMLLNKLRIRPKISCPF